MNIEELKKRLELANKQIESVVANLNLIQGAKQEMLYWIEQLEKAAKEECEKSAELDSAGGTV